MYIDPEGEHEQDSSSLTVNFIFFTSKWLLCMYYTFNKNPTFPCSLYTGNYFKTGCLGASTLL